MKNALFLFLFFMGNIALYSQSKVETLINEGIKLHDKKNYEKAIEKYGAALELEPDSWLAHYEMAFSYFESKDYENAIVHCEESIKSDQNNAYYSYVVLGSAYDLINKPKKAIKTYEKGIRKFPKQYLLYYNLALTHYNLKNTKKAEPNAIRAIELNPKHSSSHLLLAYMSNQKGERTKTVLSLYYFLMLEADSSRAKDALDLLKNLQQKGVTQRDEKNIDVVLSINDDNEFGASDLMMSLLQASNNLEENKDKPKEELFYENTKSFFTILGELNEKEEKKDFHKSFYVPYFKKMVDDGHVETLSYYIQISSQDKAIMLWLELNGKKIEEFSSWFEKNEH